MNSKFVGFALSILFHLALVGLVVNRDSLPTSAAPLEASTPLDMAMFEQAEPEPEPEPEPTPEPTPESAPVQQIEAGAPTPSDDSDDLANYKAHVLGAIRSNRNYPRRARRRDIEGVVVVGFRIQPSGALEQIRLIESSGSSLLDEAALESVRATGNVDPIPESLNRPFMDIQVPVRFELS